MRWFLLLAAVAVVVLLVYPQWRDLHRLSRLLSAFRRGDHLRVLDAAVPEGRSRHMANWLRAESAILSGHYDTALWLLKGIEETREVRRLRQASRDPDLSRLVAMVGVGRYRQAAEELGDDPAPGLRRHLRAQVAIERGEDDLGEALLADRDHWPLLEAGRSRILGDFRIRRRRIEDGIDLIRRAREEYRAAAAPGVEIDQAYCLIHVAEAMLESGEDEAATRHLDEAEALLGAFPHHAPGWSQLAAVSAETAALRGDGESARAHAARALELASAPPWVARALAAGAVAAEASGDTDQALEQCRHALELLDAMEARPAAARLRSQFGINE